MPTPISPAAGRLAVKVNGNVSVYDYQRPARISGPLPASSRPVRGGFSTGTGSISLTHPASGERSQRPLNRPLLQRPG